MQSRKENRKCDITSSLVSLIKFVPPRLSEYALSHEESPNFVFALLQDGLSSGRSSNC